MESAFKKEIETPMAFAKLDADNILYLELRPRITDVEQAEKHVLLMKKHFSEFLPLKSVVDSTKLKKVSKEARDYFGNPKMVEIFDKTAFIVGSGLSKIIINLFLKFSNPVFPTKAFKSIEKAKNWLAE